MTGRTFSYENRVLLLLCLANGVVALDRLSLSFLSPYIVADLGLSNRQLGLLAGALSIAIAASSLLLGRVADATGRRKRILIIATIGFSLFSGLSGLATGFILLFLARLLLGFAEGPMVPLSQAVMAEASRPDRRGFNMGLMQMAGAFLIGGMLGPILITRIADIHGWRATFFLSILPGLILAFALSRTLRADPPRPSRIAATAGEIGFARTLATLWSVRNIRLSVLVAGSFSAWLMIQNVFLPVYLTNVAGLAPATMGMVIGMGGIAGVIGGVTLPALSDRVGRKPVIATACFLGVLAPAATLAAGGSAILLGLTVLLGWIVLGIAPLYCAVIPSESVPPALATTAIGLAMGAGELLGGVVAPAVAGEVADRWGLAMPLWICIGLALISGVLCLFLDETAPAADQSQSPGAFPAVDR